MSKHVNKTATHVDIGSKQKNTLDHYVKTNTKAESMVSFSNCQGSAAVIDIKIRLNLALSLLYPLTGQNHQQLMTTAIKGQQLLICLLTQSDHQKTTTNSQSDQLFQEMNNLYEALTLFDPQQAILSVKDLAVSGADLLALKIPRGPRIQAILMIMLELVIARPELNKKEKLLNWLGQVLPVSEI